MRRAFLATFPQSDDLLSRYAVAQEVLINLLGADWWRSHLTLQGTRGGYLLNQPQNEEESFKNQDRVLDLARMLYALQSDSSFENLVRDLQTRDLEGAISEMDVWKLLSLSGARPHLVLRSGVRGDDFDLAAHWRENTLAIEVKSKREAPFSPSGLRESLRQSRAQLPAASGGVIIVRVPGSWAGDRDFEYQVRTTVDGFLRNTGRVNAVLIFWEEWAAYGTGRARLTRYRTYLNPRPRKPISDLASFLQSVTKLPPTNVSEFAGPF